MPQSQHTPPSGQSSASGRTAQWWKRPFLKQWLLWSLAHFCALVVLDNFLFLISHLPQVPLDAVILPLTDLGNVLRFPSRVLRACWPSEDTPQMLNWLLTASNSLVWGGLMALGRRLWRRIRS